MRLLVHVTPTQSIPINYNKFLIRNFIYSCIKHTQFDFIHNDKYKHFSFSNIFPVPIKEKIYQPQNKYKLIFSSPYNNLILLIKENIEKFKIIRLGDIALYVESLKIITTPTIINNIITATPIILRIPRINFPKYNISNKNDYAFWTNNYTIRIFNKHLIQNLIRRVYHFIETVSIYKLKSDIDINTTTQYDQNTLIDSFFSSFQFRKVVYGFDRHFNGTMWKFTIDPEYQSSFLAKYMYQTGLGERNASSGAGFVNLLDSQYNDKGKNNI